VVAVLAKPEALDALPSHVALQRRGRVASKRSFHFVVSLRRANWCRAPLVPAPALRGSPRSGLREVLCVQRAQAHATRGLVTRRRRSSGTTCRSTRTPKGVRSVASLLAHLSVCAGHLYVVPREMKKHGFGFGGRGRGPRETGSARCAAVARRTSAPRAGCVEAHFSLRCFAAPHELVPSPICSELGIERFAGKWRAGSPVRSAAAGSGSSWLGHAP
jgi:hypothetical protein